MQFIKVHVTRNELVSQTVAVRAWEVPLLELIHGQEKVEITGEVDSPHPWPEDPASEYARLELAYKATPDEKGETMNVVATVYGAGSMGQRKLHQAMKEAVSDYEKARKRRKPAPVGDSADPLAAS